MMIKEDLLKRKIRILESGVKLRDKYIEQLETQIRTGKQPPVYESLSPSHVFEFQQQHRERLHVLNLEIENIELKEEITQIKGNSNEHV